MASPLNTPHRRPRPLTRGGDPFASLSDSVNRLFGVSPRGAFADPTCGARSTSSMDVAVLPDAVRVELELPGVEPGDVEVTLDDGVLTVRAEKHRVVTSESGDGADADADPDADTKADGPTFVHQERSYGSVTRRVRLAVEVDAEAIDATLDKGVLTVLLPKLAEEDAGARRIEVKGG